MVKGFSPCFYSSFNGFLICVSLGHSLVLAHASCGPALALIVNLFMFPCLHWMLNCIKCCSCVLQVQLACVCSRSIFAALPWLGFVLEVEACCCALERSPFAGGWAAAEDINKSGAAPCLPVLDSTLRLTCISPLA